MYGALYENYNYGTSSRIAARTGQVPTGEERFYVKFDLTPFQYASAITSATLDLHCYTVTDYIPGVNDVELYGVGNNNWSESTITWYNQPENKAYQDDHTLNNLENYLDSYVPFATNMPGYHGPPADPHAIPPYVDNVFSGTVSTFVQNQFSLHNYTISIMGKSATEYYDNTWRGMYFFSKDGQQNPPDAPYTQDGPDNWPKLELTYLPPPFGVVNVNILQPNQLGLPGQQKSFTVDVTNVGGIDNENYTLTAYDNQGWSVAFAGGSFATDNTLANVRIGETREVTLNVTVPVGAAIGTKDNIFVKAVDNENSLVTDNKNRILTATNQIVVTGSTMVSSAYPENDIENNYVRIESSPGQLWDNATRTFAPDNGNVRFFLQFNLGGIPSSQIVTSARVNMWCWAARYDDMNAQIYAVDNDNWNGQVVTWNNQPKMDNTPLDTVRLTSQPDQPGPIGVENTWVPGSATPSASAGWEVGSYVQGQRLIDNIASFGVKAAVENTNGQYFFDSESSKDPTYYPVLVLTFGTAQAAVSESISPVHRVGDTSLTRTYTITVLNKGTATDNFTFENTDTGGWSKVISPSRINGVSPGKSATTTLTVTLSSTAGSSDNITVTARSMNNASVTSVQNVTASTDNNNHWSVAGYSPDIENYAVAETGAGTSIYVANSSLLGNVNNFMRYDTANGGSWTYLPTPMVSSPFKNGTVLAWDKGSPGYIYALLGGDSSDNAANHSARHWFFRYNISTGKWENLKPTGNTDNENNNLGAQGAGDALVFAGSNTLYAMVGDNVKGSTFWSYNTATNTWTQISVNFPWTKTGVGASMVYTGADNIYVFQGSGSASDNFYRYSILGNTWTTSLAKPPAIGAGGSLAWIAGDNIYALLGGNPSTQQIRDNCFYVYSIAGNSWTKLENLPLAIGDQNGPRLGVTGGNLYVWRGPVVNPSLSLNPVLWQYNVPAVLIATGTASIRMAGTGSTSPPFLWGISKANVNTNLTIYQGDNLHMIFLAQDNHTVESDNVIWSRTAPGAQVVTLTNLIVPHDSSLTWPAGGSPSINLAKPASTEKRIKLVLTDSSGNIILDNMAWYRIVQDDWSNRISWIILRWGSHTSPQQDQLSNEISAIIISWGTVPTAHDQHDFLVSP
jgi:hypothetical protein